MCLQKFTWKIKLKWEDGHLFFDQEWIKFARPVNLREEYTLVLASTLHAQKFNVTIIEKRNTCDSRFGKKSDV